MLHQIRGQQFFANFLILIYPFNQSTPKESSNAYSFVKTRISNYKILWNKFEQCFPVMYGYFQRNLTKIFKILKFEFKTSKNESRKFTIFQTYQYEKQNSNLSNVFRLVTWINET